MKHGAGLTYIYRRGVSDALEYSRTGTALCLLRAINDYGRLAIQSVQHPFLQALKLSKWLTCTLITTLLRDILKVVDRRIRELRQRN